MTQPSFEEYWANDGEGSSRADKGDARAAWQACASAYQKQIEELQFQLNGQVNPALAEITYMKAQLAAAESRALKAEAAAEEMAKALRNIEEYRCTCGNNFQIGNCGCYKHAEFTADQALAAWLKAKEAK